MPILLGLCAIVVLFGAAAVLHEAGELVSRLRRVPAISPRPVRPAQPARSHLEYARRS